jgi:hypothetical protein
MLHWPLNCPHRIVNADCLNVSFTTEHMTDELRNAYAVNYANGTLRRTLGLQNLARPTTGLGLYARLGLAAAYKFSGLQTRRKPGFKIDFKVDPTAPFSVRNVPAFDLRK